MALPDTYRAFRRTTGPPYPLTIHPTTEPLPHSLAPHAVLLRIHAISLNYRDIAMLAAPFPMPVAPNGIPTSDCAAEVVAVGDAVTRVRVGERVAPNVDVAHVTGEERDEGGRALGGEVEGVLGEFAVVGEEVLVRVPAHLAWEEAATVPCAGLAAWMALGQLEGLGEGSSVLLEGERWWFGE